MNKYRKGTGGGPSTSVAEQLTPTEQQILETMSTTAINGHENVAESGVVVVHISLFLHNNNAHSVQELYVLNPVFYGFINHNNNIFVVKA